MSVCSRITSNRRVLAKAYRSGSGTEPEAAAASCCESYPAYRAQLPPDTHMLSKLMYCWTGLGLPPASLFGYLSGAWQPPSHH